MEVINGMLKRENNSHWRLNGEPKIKYKTERDAVLRCYEMNMQDKTRYKIISYKCPVCKMWHVGHSQKELSPKDKEKIKRKYREICIKLNGFWC